eukprot:scaffold141378_cov31-Tisochrysis_lutea.AAC.3
MAARLCDAVSWQAPIALDSMRHAKNVSFACQLQRGGPVSSTSLGFRSSRDACKPQALLTMPLLPLFLFIFSARHILCMGQATSDLNTNNNACRINRLIPRDHRGYSLVCRCMSRNSLWGAASLLGRYNGTTAWGGMECAQVLDDVCGVSMARWWSVSMCTMAWSPHDGG